MKKFQSKFPAARIKRILQTNEEIGKISTDAPIVLSACLEAFLEQLIDAAAEEAQERNSSSIAPHHLRACILKEETFDFLKDTVDGIDDIKGTEDVEDNSGKKTIKRKRKIKPEEVENETVMDKKLKIGVKSEQSPQPAVKKEPPPPKPVPITVPPPSIQTFISPLDLSTTPVGPSPLDFPSLPTTPSALSSLPVLAPDTLSLDVGASLPSISSAYDNDDYD